MAYLVAKKTGAFACREIAEDGRSYLLLGSVELVFRIVDEDLKQFIPHRERSDL